MILKNTSNFFPLNKGFVLENRCVYCEVEAEFLPSFAKQLRKVSVNFVTSVCPSIRPSAWENWAATGRFCWISCNLWWILTKNLSIKFVDQIQVLSKSYINNAYLTYRLSVHLCHWSSWWKQAVLWFLVIVQLDAQILVNVFIYL